MFQPAAWLPELSLVAWVAIILGLSILVLPIVASIIYMSSVCIRKVFGCGKVQSAAVMETKPEPPKPVKVVVKG